MEVDVNKVPELLEEDTVEVLDVREPNELSEDGYIEGTKNTPMSEFDVDELELDKNKQYYVMCKAGGRSAKVVEYMKNHGYDATNLSGGILGYNGEKLYK